MNKVCDVFSKYIGGKRPAKVYLKHNNNGYYLNTTKLRYETIIKNIKLKNLTNIYITDEISVPIDKITTKIFKQNVKMTFPGLSGVSDEIERLNNRLNRKVKSKYMEILE